LSILAASAATWTARLSGLRHRALGCRALPKTTPGRTGVTLEQRSLYVVYPGERRYGLAERMLTVPLSAVLPMASR